MEDVKNKYIADMFVRSSSIKEAINSNKKMFVFL